MNCKHCKKKLLIFNEMVQRYNKCPHCNTEIKNSVNCYVCDEEKEDTIEYEDSILCNDCAGVSTEEFINLEMVY